MMAGLVLLVEKRVGTKQLLGSRLDGSSGVICFGWSRLPAPSANSRRISVYRFQEDWRPWFVPEYILLYQEWRMSSLLNSEPGISEKCSGKMGLSDFYTIKSSWVGDLLVKILTYYFHF